jgi:hypothetical protein
MLINSRCISVMLLIAAKKHGLLEKIDTAI